MADRSVSVRLDANVSGFERGMVRAKASAALLRKELNDSNDTTSWLAGSLLALAPAAVPIGAVMIPTVAALTTHLALAAAGAGTMALAFVGVGDGLKALNDYQLDPTKENLKQLNEAMKKLGPDGADFVKFLDSVGPQFRQLQLAARGGMFPGVEDGINGLLERLPDLKAVVTEISTAIGTLTSDAGAGIAGSEFDAFFDFLKNDAQPIILDTGRAFGNFADGLASMMVAFGPLTKDFSGGLLDMSKRFEEWAEELGDSQGFHEFVDYVREVTPQVKALFGDMVDTFVALSQAAAPAGAVMIPLLQGLLKVIEGIASTPVGPILITVTAISSLAGRLLALKNLAGGGVIGAALTGQFTAMGTAAKKAGEEAERSARRVQMMRVGGSAALFALSTGLSSVHTESTTANRTLGILGSTAAGAATGAFFGPWGVALGAAGGAALGVTQAILEADSATRRSTDSAKAWGVAFDKALPDKRLLDTMSNVFGMTPGQRHAVVAEDQSGIRFSRPKNPRADIGPKLDVSDLLLGVDKAQRELDSLGQRRPAKLDANNRPLLNKANQSTTAINNIRQKSLPKIDVDTSKAIDKVNQLISMMTGLGGLVSLPDLIPGGTPKKPTKRAAGGPIFGPGTETSDDILIRASNDEHMWTAAEVRAAGGHDAMYRLRAAALMGELPAFKRGGQVRKGKQTVLQDERALEEARLRADIRRGRRELNAKGKESLRGWDRTVAMLELRENRAALDRLLAGGNADAKLDADSAIESAQQALMDAGGGFSLFERKEPASPWFVPSAGGGFAARAQQTLAQMKTLSAKFAQLREAGLSPALIGQISAIGSLPQEIAIADELLRSPGEIGQLNSAYAGIQTARQYEAALGYTQAPSASQQEVRVSLENVSLDAVNNQLSLRAVVRDEAGKVIGGQAWKSSVAMY